MICVGIDIAKDKHDCFILNSTSVVLDVFTIQNNISGFRELIQRIKNCFQPIAEIKIGLDATGHYSYNILRFLLDDGLTTYVLNPLNTNIYRKNLSLRRMQTNRIDAHTIATMLTSMLTSNPTPTQHITMRS